MPKNKNKKKKNLPNAFGMYLRERRKKLSQEGYVFPGGEQDIRAVCDQDFKNLTPEEQEPYKVQAKEEKEKRKKDMTQKFTSTGESYAELNERRLEAQQAREEIEKMIDNLTLTSSIPQPERHFIVIKTIHSCIEHNTQTYWPSELAVAVFNLKEGLKCYFSTLINTKIIPSGYYTDVRDACDETGLPQPDSSSQATGFEPQETDYLQIIGRIRTLVEEYLDNYPRDFVLFALNDKEVISADGCLRWLFENAKQSMDEAEIPRWEYFFSHLRFYPLPKLVLRFAKVAKAISHTYLNAMLIQDLHQAAEALLNGTTYNYRSAICCNHHTREEYCHKIDHCCQNIAIRSVYMIVNHFVKPFKLPPQDGHDIEKFSKIFPPAPRRRPMPTNGNCAPDSKNVPRPRSPAKNFRTNAANPELERLWASAKARPQSVPPVNSAEVTGARSMRGGPDDETPAPSSAFTIQAPISSSPSAPRKAPQIPHSNPGPGRGHGLTPNPTQENMPIPGPSFGRGHGQGSGNLQRFGQGRGMGRGAGR